ncbi:MAG: low molecular weight protein-tyrosine-phosphatase [Clostridia bacterium]
MIKILFVCHGNICRSPMAEFVFKDIAEKRGVADKLYIASAATSTEEIGNGVHRGTRDKLREHGISTDGKYAVQIVKSDYSKYDFLIGMDRWNIQNMNRMLGGDSEGKIYKLLDFTDRKGDIADPWYTGDFDATYADVLEGCMGLMDYLDKNGYIE